MAFRDFATPQMSRRSLIRSGALMGAGAAFAGLQVFDSDTKCVHFGEYVLYSFIKLAGLDVAGLLLQFFNLALNID